MAGYSTPGKEGGSTSRGRSAPARAGGGWGIRGKAGRGYDGRGERGKNLSQYFYPYDCFSVMGLWKVSGN